MILKFPDLDTLRLALTTGAVPLTASQKPAVAGFDGDEQVWVETQARLPASAQEELKRLGAQVCRTNGAGITKAVSCWPELLPLLPDNAPIDHLDQTPVLFELTTGEQLTRLALEVLRLGNDRQGYRWFSEPEAKDAGGHALLRVVGPPYYSLLRAIDHGGQEGAPRAYLERAERVWVELGFTHPLVERIKAPEEQMLLIRSPGVWTAIDDGEFRDVYTIAEFPLPVQEVAWTAGDLKSRLRVTPGLRTGGKPDDPELWVLREDAVTELNRFVQDADDQQLARLSFAVGEFGGQTTIVLRVRQSRLPPPVLVLNAVGYRHYLKLTNLFLPVGTTLHPPLRRDQVRKLLADDPSRVIWLRPGDKAHEFIPESLPEDAFRPLGDWVDYVIDRDEQQLKAWVQAASFDFEAFVCDEEQPAKPRKPTDRDRQRSGRGGPLIQGETTGGTQPDSNQRKTNDPAKDADEEEILDALPAEPNVLAENLTRLEERFLSLEGALDSEDRVAMWPELATLHAALNHVDESGVCWMNALWYQARPSTEMAWRWFRNEATVSARDDEPPTVQPWAAQALAAGRPREVSGSDLQRLLRQEDPLAADLRALAAYLTWAASRDPAPAALQEELNDVQQFLEEHERLLPVRAVWLAWTSVARLSRGDALALARARDRLLERLFQNGLRPEQDLPGFLHFAGQPSSQRFRGVRQWMTNLASLAQNWIQKKAQDASSGGRPPETSAYADLIFAYGLARLGEQDTAREFLGRAKASLKDADKRYEKPDGHEAVHRLLFDAFAVRIADALEGKPSRGSLPAALMKELEEIGSTKEGRMPVYVVDRMRQHSKILEPVQKIDPYEAWTARTGDLEKSLVDLAKLTDRAKLAERVTKLLRELPKGAKANESRVKIIRAALDLSPRIGEEFAKDMLGRIDAVYDAFPAGEETATLMMQAELLEKALTIAAHFDLVDFVHPLVDRFKELLRSQKGENAIRTLESLAGQCLRGLRKLGLRDKIDELLEQMSDLVLEGRELKAQEANAFENAPAMLKALLHVAGGWYFFGRDRQAEPIMSATRSLIFASGSPIKGIKEHTSLACLYAQTLGQAPVETAQRRLEELFKKLAPLVDGWTTAPYYCLTQLGVVESAVLAVVSDDFTLGSNARRWLDDDEYLVRRRIHRDLRELMAHA
jgi:hypothetical protein